MVEQIVTIDPETLGGTPCFFGTRVPVAVLFENLADGLSLTQILDAYPSITKDAAVKALEIGQGAFAQSKSQNLYLTKTSENKEPQSADGLYKTDFRLWLAEQATLLHTKHVDKIDCENLAEEIQTLFDKQENELAETIEMLNVQMTEWIDGSDRTPEAYSAIVELRMLAEMRLELSPSLSSRAAHYFDKAVSKNLKLSRDYLMSHSLDKDIIEMSKTQKTTDIAEKPQSPNS